MYPALPVSKDAPLARTAASGAADARECTGANIHGHRQGRAASSLLPMTNTAREADMVPKRYAIHFRAGVVTECLVQDLVRRFSP